MKSLFIFIFALSICYQSFGQEIQETVQGNDAQATFLEYQAPVADLVQNLQHTFINDEEEDLEDSRDSIEEDDDLKEDEDSIEDEVDVEEDKASNEDEEDLAEREQEQEKENQEDQKDKDFDQDSKGGRFRPGYPRYPNANGFLGYQRYFPGYPYPGYYPGYYPETPFQDLAGYYFGPQYYPSSRYNLQSFRHSIWNPQEYNNPYLERRLQNQMHRQYNRHSQNNRGFYALEEASSPSSVAENRRDFMFMNEDLLESVDFNADEKKSQDQNLQQAMFQEYQNPVALLLRSLEASKQS